MRKPVRMRVEQLLVVMGAAALVACAGSETTSPPPSHDPARISVHGGDDQSVVAGSAVPISPAVLVTDSSGLPVSDVPVAFAVVDGGGQIAGASQMTNAQGVATVGRWVLGDTAGANAVTSTVGGLPTVTFHAVATTGAAASIITLSGDQQTAMVSGELYGITFLVTDAYGNPVSTTTQVTFAVTGGGGSILAPRANTDLKGVAILDSWTLGAEAGPNTLTATIAGAPPVTVSATAVGFELKSLAAGGDHTCGLAATGAAYCWGANDAGQLGDGTTTMRSTPVAVTGGYTFRALAAGDLHTCGLRTDGAILCWGGNDSGQVGNGTTSVSAPPSVVVGGRSYSAVTAGSAHTCALATTAFGDEDVLCWGSNASGQLGDGTFTSSSVPVQSLSVTPSPDLAPQIAAGAAATCVLGGENHFPTCWGRLHHADGTTTTSSSPAYGESSVSFFAIVGGGEHFCGIDYDPSNTGSRGAIRCWGLGTNGVIGDGTETSYDAPGPQVLHPTGSSELTGMLALGRMHTCAANRNQATMCWGSNASGQLGDGTVTNRFTPVPVLGGTIPFSIVAGGSDHTCGILLSGLRSAGPVFCWGSNASGQLGDGSTTMRLQPTLVSAP